MYGVGGASGVGGVKLGQGLLGQVGFVATLE